MWAVGGGSRSATWRQIVADVLGCRLSVLQETDSAFGVALLGLVALDQVALDQAALGHGGFGPAQGYTLRRPTVQPTSPIDVRPCAENSQVYDTLFVTYKKIQRALQPVYDDSADDSDP